VFEMSAEATAGAIAAGLNISEQLDTDLATLGQLLSCASTAAGQALAVCAMLIALAGVPELQEAHAKALGDLVLDKHAVWSCPFLEHVDLGWIEGAHYA
jgi:hypothetical protein